MTKNMSVDYSKDTDTYMVFGHGTRMEMEDLDEAKHMADELARQKAREEAVERGADESRLTITLDVKENIVQTEYGPLYMGYKVIATASGALRLS